MGKIYNECPALNFNSQFVRETRRLQICEILAFFLSEVKIRGKLLSLSLIFKVKLFTIYDNKSRYIHFVTKFRKNVKWQICFK